MRLPELQHAMTMALLEGPDRVPFGAFADRPQRILMAFKVHANSISFARLRALEDCFPRMRLALGDRRFNRLSRAFVDSHGASGRALNDIGETFPEFAAEAGVAPGFVALARVERAWLEVWRAPDATVLTQAALARFDEVSLLALKVMRNPAARLVEVPAATLDLLELKRGCAVLISRPEFGPEMASADPALIRFFNRLEAPTTLAELLSQADDDPLTTFGRALACGLVALPGEARSC